MKKFLGLALALITGGMLLVSVPAAAESSYGTDTAAVAAPADGHFYVYYRLNRSQQCGAWSRSTHDLGGCGTGAESLWNNGFPGANDDVFVHADTKCNGWRRGVYNGVWLDDLRKWSFDGGGPPLWHNLRSMCWVQLP